jgi:RNA polymerase sigma factor (sigma-70 family)
MAIMQNKPNDPNEAARAMHKVCTKLAHKAVKSNQQDFDDVYQYAQMGVARAYKDYSPDRGCAFSSLAYRYAATYVMDNYMRKAYDYNNNRSYKTAEEVLENTVTYNGAEERLEFQQILGKMNTTDQIITLMRQQGYTYQECADALNKCGNSYTLHQVRNRHNAALAA